MNGEVLHILESDAAQHGLRRVASFFVQEGQEWWAAIETNAPSHESRMWARASIRDGVATLRFAMDSYSARQIAMLVVTTIASWPGGPHDLVLGWSGAPSGVRPRESAAEQPGSRPAGTPRVRDRQGKRIDVLYVPHDWDDRLRLVSIDRRDVTRWYQYLSGGPAEGVLLEIAGMRDHELYVNSRYPNLDPSAVNDTATAILEHFGVRMSLGHIRGDALLMRAAGSRYPKPIEQGLVDQLCG